MIVIAAAAFVLLLAVLLWLTSDRSDTVGICFRDSTGKENTTYRQQLKQELSAQIKAVRKYFPEGAPVRLDGHAHYHMIPVVFDAMMDVIREEELPVSYIRIPREYLRIYLPHLKNLQEFSPINIVKVMILNFLSLRAEIRYGKILKNLEKKLLSGVALMMKLMILWIANILLFLIHLLGD